MVVMKSRAGSDYRWERGVVKEAREIKEEQKEEQNPKTYFKHG
jgi:hypothetical protein